MFEYKDIQAIHLEITENCQAACPMCPRTGNSKIAMAELSIDDIKKFFNQQFILQLKTIAFCGNYGEPIVAADCLEIVKYFRLHNSEMHIGINSNGGARSKQWWQELAHTLGNRGHVTFGIDGLTDTNHIYRVNVKYDNAINNAKHFIEAGGNAKWDFLVFKHNEHQVEQAKQIATEIGFKKFRVKKTYRFGYHWSNNDGKQAKNIEPSEKYFNDHIKTLVKDEEYFDQIDIDCKAKNLNEFYLSAHGYVFPCCYVGGQLYDNDQNQLWSLIDFDKISLKQNTLEQVFDTQYLFEIEKLWKKSTIKDGKPLICAKTCGKDNMIWDSQFK
jgi:MoaA/NifB/PqqE/SkfB family radical SAM enzyme